MSQLNFITANPFVKPYQEQVAAQNQQELALDTAARGRATWMLGLEDRDRAATDRKALAESQDRQIKMLEATAPVTAPARPAVPARPAAAFPGTQSAAPGQMAEPADLSAAVPSQAAVPEQRGSAALRSLGAMGSHPSGNVERERAIRDYSVAQTQLERDKRIRDDKVADRVHELAVSNDPTKLAMARELARQHGINDIPETYWTDANVRAKMDARRKNMTTPIETGGEHTLGPDGKTLIYKAGNLIERDPNTGNFNEITDNKGNTFGGKGHSALRLTVPGGAGGAGGAGSTSKQIEVMKWKSGAYQRIGIEPGLSDAAAANPALLATPQSIAVQARFIMTKQVDIMGRPTITMEAAMASAQRQLEGAQRVAPPTDLGATLAPQGATPPRAGDARTGRAEDRRKIIEEELAAVLASVPKGVADTERRAADIDALNRELGRGGPPASTAPASAAPASAAPKQPPKLGRGDRAAFDKLKSGDKFIDPNGKVREKP